MDKNAIFNDVRMAAMKAYAITQKTLPYKTGLLSNQFPGKEGGFRIETLSPGTYKIYIDLSTVPYAEYIDKPGYRTYGYWDKAVENYVSIMAHELGGTLKW